MNPNETTYSHGDGGAGEGMLQDREEEREGEGIGAAVSEKMSAAKSVVADKMSAAKNYVQERGVRGLTKDVGELVGKYPVTAMAFGAGLGYLVGRAMRRR